MSAPPLDRPLRLDFLGAVDPSLDAKLDSAGESSSPLDDEILSCIASTRLGREECRSLALLSEDDDEDATGGGGGGG